MTAPRPRKHIAVWPITLGALLLLWAGGLVWLKFGPTRMPSTGDDLLDAYLLLANDTEGIPADKRPELEKKFGSDPRYWEIVTADFGEYGHSNDDAHEHSALANYYRKMRSGERPQSIYLLDRYVVMQKNAWEEESRVDPPARDPHAPKLTSAERHARYTKTDRAISKSIDKLHAAERTELYEELVAAAPDNAKAWYRKAHLHNARNEYEQALACIRKGNAAPVNVRPLPFPLPEYIRSLDGTGPLAGHPRAYLLATPLLSAPMLNFIEVKHTHFALWSEALQRNDRAGLNVLHSYACRLGMTDECDILSGLVCVVLLKHEANAVLNLPGLTMAQRTEIGNFTAMADKIKSELRSISHSSPSNKFFGNPAAGGLMGLMRGQSMDLNSRIMHDDNVWVRAEYEKRVLPELEAIAKFDFVTLTFKP